MHIDLVGLVAVVMGCLWLSGALEILAKKVPGKGQKELLKEVTKLREEVEQLRRESRDVILSFDGSVKHLERRLDHLEANALPPSTVTRPSEEQRLTLNR